MMTETESTRTAAASASWRRASSSSRRFIVKHQNEWGTDEAMLREGSLESAILCVLEHRTYIQSSAWLVVEEIE